MILPMVGLRGNRQETETNIELGLWQRVNGGVNASQTSRFRLASASLPAQSAGPMPPESRRNATTPPPRKSARPSSPARPTSSSRSGPAPTTLLHCSARCSSGWTVALAWAGSSTRSTAGSTSTAPAKPSRKRWKTRRRWTARMFCPASPSACDSTSSTCNSSRRLP